MRAVVQRVSGASVTVEGVKKGEIGKGLMEIIGIDEEDKHQDGEYIADKLEGLRKLEDDEGKMNRSVTDVNGAILLVSQFTLCGDARKGRRPSFIRAARPEKAIPLYEKLISHLSETLTVETGEFGADMQVALVNDGPVTILLDSKRLF